MIWVVWVFSRTIMSMQFPYCKFNVFFSSCRTSNWRFAVLQCFLLVNQTKLLSMLISNMLIILALKGSGKCFLTPQNKYFWMGRVVLGVAAGNVSRCFVT